MRGLLVTAGVVGLLHAASPVLAQVPDGSAHRAGIERLSFMVGRWRGEAWMQRGPERVHTTMTETVAPRLDGAVLLVEGLGVLPGTDSTAARPVHQALAVVTFDPQAGSYNLRSYIATGQSGDFALTLVDGGVSWTREVPGGRIRNTAHIGGDTWHEIGEFSRDGVTWMQIMEMNLRREP
jgi:hypothetical protein